MEYKVCTSYGAGDFEQARNLSQLTGYRVTVLEPRHATTGGSLRTNFSNLLCYDSAPADWTNCGYTEAPYPEENRDPSVFFASYQTGDNRVVTGDTGPEPMDMYYSRAFEFGDDYELVEYTTSSDQLVERWDWLAQGKLVRPDDADLTATPAGERLHAVWSQEDLDKKGEVIGVDAWYRRVFYDILPRDTD